MAMDPQILPESVAVTTFVSPIRINGFRYSKNKSSVGFRASQTVFGLGIKVLLKALHKNYLVSYSTSPCLTYVACSKTKQLNIWSQTGFKPPWPPPDSDSQLTAPPLDECLQKWCERGDLERVIVRSEGPSEWADQQPEQMNGTCNRMCWDMQSVWHIWLYFHNECHMSGVIRSLLFASPKRWAGFTLWGTFSLFSGQGERKNWQTILGFHTVVHQV